jgi:hypothetical protein
MKEIYLYTYKALELLIYRNNERAGHIVEIPKLILQLDDTFKPKTELGEAMKKMIENGDHCEGNIYYLIYLLEKRYEDIEILTKQRDELGQSNKGYQELIGHLEKDNKQLKEQRDIFRESFNNMEKYARELAEPKNTKVGVFLNGELMYGNYYNHHFAIECFDYAKELTTETGKFHEVKIYEVK